MSARGLPRRVRVPRCLGGSKGHHEKVPSDPKFQTLGFSTFLSWEVRSSE